MAILRNIYLSSGIILYIFINVISYSNINFEGELSTKIIFSSISLVLLAFDYASILMTTKLYKRPFKDFTIFIKITLYMGILVFPLISLYYR